MPLTTSMNRPTPNKQHTCQHQHNTGTIKYKNKWADTNTNAIDEHLLWCRRRHRCHWPHEQANMLKCQQVKWTTRQHTMPTPAQMPTASNEEQANTPLVPTPLTTSTNRPTPPWCQHHWLQAQTGQHHEMPTSQMNNLPAPAQHQCHQLQAQTPTSQMNNMLVQPSHRHHQVQWQLGQDRHERRHRCHHIQQRMGQDQQECQCHQVQQQMGQGCKNANTNSIKPTPMPSSTTMNQPRPARMLTPSIPTIVHCKLHVYFIVTRRFTDTLKYLLMPPTSSLWIPVECDRYVMLSYPYTIIFILSCFPDNILIRVLDVLEVGGCFWHPGSCADKVSVPFHGHFFSAERCQKQPPHSMVGDGISCLAAYFCCSVLTDALVQMILIDTTCI